VDSWAETLGIVSKGAVDESSINTTRSSAL
jgi:hypothetical protein